MIPVLILSIATLIAGIIASMSHNPAVYEGLGELSRWGMRLLGKAITVIILINAVWVGLRTIGLLK